MSHERFFVVLQLEGVGGPQIAVPVQMCWRFLKRELLIIMRSAATRKSEWFQKMSVDHHLAHKPQTTNHMHLCSHRRAS